MLGSIIKDQGEWEKGTEGRSLCHRAIPDDALGLEAILGGGRGGGDLGTGMRRPRDDIGVEARDDQERHFDYYGGI